MLSQRKRKSRQSQNMEQIPVTSLIGPSFFYEDEVFRFGKNGDLQFGMVTENWDMYSSSDEEDDEFDEMEKVPNGFVAVTWLPKSKTEVVLENKVQLSDRSLMPGDVVRRLIAGKDTQRGYCRSVKVVADVQLVGTKKVIMGVPATSLKPMQKLQPDTAVYMDSWIGVIRDAKYNITLKFSDGSICVVDSNILTDHFEEVRNGVDLSSPEIFFPGQKLHGKMRCLKDIDFTTISDDLKRAKDKKSVNVIVTKVEAVSVTIQWQWQTPGGKDGTCVVKPSSETVTGENLKKVHCLNLFDSCTVQICDVSFLQLPKDGQIDKAEWKKKMLEQLNRSEFDSQTKKLSESEDANNSTVVEARKVRDEDDDLLTDENEEDGKNNKQSEREKSSSKVSTTKKLLPKLSTRSLKKKKLKKASKQPSLPKMGAEAVVETLHTQSFVDVIWQDGTSEEEMRSIDLYPIHHMDDHEFFPGDFVINAESNDIKIYGVIQKMDHCARLAVVKWFETYSCDGDQNPKPIEEVEMSVYDIKDHPDFRFRPGTIVIRIANMQDQPCPAGQILDNYPDGQVRVWWATGDVSSCWPQDLFRLGEYDSDDTMWDEDENRRSFRNSDSDVDYTNEEGANSDSSWETEPEGEDETFVENTPNKLAEDGKCPDSAEVKHALESDDSTVPVNAHGLPSAIQIQLHDPLLPTTESSKFKMVEKAPETHSYRLNTFMPQNYRQFVKTVQKEISLLRESLPDGILVKGFEDRMDLYCVMIEGPEKTPYEDSLFFFDIDLPPQYPSVPPLVHYKAFCTDRLNPNLYEDGKVCVSLLGTWNGKGTEVWTSSSSLLQLLVSIQGLILGPEPYYNEAGYEKQKGTQQGAENARMYNENVLIKLVQSMQRMLVSPGAAFQEESASYIKIHGPRMVQRYRGWLDAQAASSSSSSPSTSVELPSFPLLPVSRGFQLTLSKSIAAFEKLLSQQ